MARLLAMGVVLADTFMNELGYATEAPIPPRTIQDREPTGTRRVTDLIKDDRSIRSRDRSRSGLLQWEKKLGMTPKPQPWNMALGHPSAATPRDHSHETL